MNSDAIYDFSSYDIYFCSDWEGQIPETLTSEKDSPFILDGQGKITGLQPNKAFVFLGDAIDNGPNDIEIMQTFIRLKTEYPERVCLLMGNRDVNKLRLTDEMDIMKKDETEKTIAALLRETQHNLDTLAQNIITKWGTTYSFRFNYNDLNLAQTVGMIENTLTPAFAGWKNPDTFCNGLERVSKIYNNTMGAFKTIDYRLEELLKMGLITSIPADPNTRYAIIAILNSWMGRIWTNKSNKTTDFMNSTVYENDQLNLIWANLNGLHIRYLNCCNVYATIKVGDRNIAFVSHGGMPLDGILSHPFGYRAKMNAQMNTASRYSTIKTFHKALHEQFNKMLRDTFTSSLKTIAAVAPLRKRDNVLRKYIAASAQLGDISSGPFKHHFEQSPIVATTGATSTQRPERLNARQSGGNGPPSWIDTNTSDGVQYIDLIGLFTYNIMGHIPQGLIPTVRERGQGKYSVCTDVSKAFAIEKGSCPAKTYAFFVIPANQLPYITGVLQKDANNRTNEASLDLTDKTSTSDLTNKTTAFIDGILYKIDVTGDISSAKFTADKYSVTFASGGPPTFTQKITITSSQTGGARKHKINPLKKTELKRKVAGRERVIYLGPHGAHYVKIQKQYVKVSELKESKSRPISSCRSPSNTQSTIKSKSHSHCSCKCHPNNKSCTLCKHVHLH